MTRSGLVLVFRLTAIAALLLSPIARAEAPPFGAKSPEELVERFNVATAKGEVSSKLPLLSPAARSLHTLSLLLAATMVSAMERVGKELGQEVPPEAIGLEGELETILGRHGLTERMQKMKSESPLEAESEEERDRLLAKLFDGVDTIRLAAELEGLLKKGSGGKFRPTTWTLSNPKAEGDRGTVTAENQTIDILRIEGRWYLEPKGPPPGRLPPGS